MSAVNERLIACADSDSFSIRRGICFARDFSLTAAGRGGNWSIKPASKSENENTNKCSNGEFQLNSAALSCISFITPANF